MDFNEKPAIIVNNQEFVIHPFEARPEIRLSFTKIKQGETRLVEAKVVNSATYSELEYTFNEGYREARQALTTIGYEITQAEKSIREAKSEALIDKYPEFLKEKKFKDSSQIRDAFLQTQERYVKAQDRLDMLTALREHVTTKIKVFENVCKYMKKQMDLEIRSGFVNSNKYMR